MVGVSALHHGGCVSPASWWVWYTLSMVGYTPLSMVGYTPLSMVGGIYEGLSQLLGITPVLDLVLSLFLFLFPGFMPVLCSK